MDYLHLGLTRKAQEAHYVCCSFYEEEFYTLPTQNEMLLSKYSFPLLEVAHQELLLISEFAGEIGKSDTFLLLAQQCSFVGITYAIEQLKPPAFYKNISGRYESGRFIPTIEFESEEPKILCRCCMQVDLSSELNNVIKLLFNTGKVLVEKAPIEKIIRYWEN